MTPDGWEGLQLADPEIARKQQVDKDDVDRLYLRVFGSDDGQKLLTHLRSLTIEQPTWYPGEDASHGFAREGQNSLVREIERRMQRAREL
mgnify:CR=1 FL=1|jgi:hypothetical protein|tara:strand:- start:1593 stop:1862 length:270 start_codon:yes stop_codon:yes gene_type:complete